MLNYLSKFVLQMLPTISATVIGAYIVSTWINPKTPPEPPKVAARAQEPAKVEPAKAEPAKVTSAPAQATEPVQEASAEPVEAKPTEAKPAEAKAEAKPVEAPKPVKAASAPDKVRIIPIVKPSNDAPAAATASVPAPSSPEAAAASDERKDANKDVNELARAAILRLRGNETARVTDEPGRPVVSTVRVQQPRVAPEGAPSSAAIIAPPLPPAVSIAAPRMAPGESADQAAAYPERMSPPGEIPVARNPLNLQASARIENPSIADDFLSATKSFFRAITP